MTSDALPDLAADPRLAQLEALLRRPSPFNILTALGVGRQELRHSDLLAYLLNPHRPHGLGDRLTRALLRRAGDLLAEPLDVDALALGDLSVQREWSFIDILVESPADKLVIIIENKVDSGEHSDQLSRYYRQARKHRPGWRVLGIYLTLDATPPAEEHDRARYAPLGYADVAAALSAIAGDVEVEPDVQTLLRHYAQMIRSKLVPDADSDVTRTALGFYMEHHAALDAVIRARDARQKMIQQTFDRLLTATIKAHPDMLRRDEYLTDFNIHRWYTRFSPVEWYQPDLQVAQRWTKSQLGLLFEFYHDPKQVSLVLNVGPAPQAHALRQALYDLAVQQRQPFRRAWNDPSGDYFNIYARPIFRPEDNYFATYDDEAIRRAIRASWDDFLKRDLPVIKATIRHEILGRSWDNL